MSYLDTARDVYRNAALVPQPTLCCAPGQRLRLPGLSIPREMEEMNYGCGTTVHPQDLSPDADVLYLGVGSGLEALQFAYFTRRPASVIALDAVPEMLDRAARNLELAAAMNPWFRTEFVRLEAGDVLDLPVSDGCVDLVSQNCLFNILMAADLDRALAEAGRVLKPGGRLVLSDPICERPIPTHLRDDETLRAECLSGAVPLEEYLGRITAAGFGTVEIRGRRPYRMLDRTRYRTDEDLLLETVELVAIRGSIPEDGPCVFAGETAIYRGPEESFDDGRGHLLQRGVPLSVCRKTAARFDAMKRQDLVVTPPTWHYAGGGCC